MTFAPTLTRTSLMRAWLPAFAAAVLLVALMVFALNGPTPATSVTPSTDAAPAVPAPAEEPWVPSVITFSGERPARTGPLLLEDLDPNCPCMPGN